MSRRIEIQEAGKYVGLSAAHWACYGDAWREVGDYRTRADEILSEITLTGAEFNSCPTAAAKRSRQYIHVAYTTVGKTLLPPDEVSANRSAGEDIDAILLPYKPSAG
ncbi:MAG TPA: hypothetical protein VNL71_07060 [Chloroflexota bacterium]|nr:hypothetical protein [Chloroflexota bacterium]